MSMTLSSLIFTTDNSQSKGYHQVDVTVHIFFLNEFAIILIIDFRWLNTYCQENVDPMKL